MEFVPSITGPEPRDFVEFLDSDRGEEFFRGVLLPRMRGVFGRGDWVANGVLFALYHLHTPRVIPPALIPIEAYSSRRFESALMGIVVHSTQSVVLIIVVLTLVLA